MRLNEFGLAASLLKQPLDTLHVGDYDLLTRASRSLYGHRHMFMEKVAERVMTAKGIQKDEISYVARVFIQTLIDRPGTAIKVAREEPTIVSIAIEIFKQAHTLSHLGTALTVAVHGATMHETGGSATN